MSAADPYAALHSHFILHSPPPNAPTPPSAPSPKRHPSYPAHELLPAHIRHNAKQARNIAFYVSARRLLRTNAYAHALRSTRRLISALPVLRGALRRYSCIFGAHPSLSSLSSVSSAAVDDQQDRDNADGAYATGRGDGTRDIPRRVDGLQAPHMEAQRRPRRRSAGLLDRDSYTKSNHHQQAHHPCFPRSSSQRSAATQDSSSYDPQNSAHLHRSTDGENENETETENDASATVVHSVKEEITQLEAALNFTAVSLTSSRERAQRAMAGIPAAHDVFVLLSVFLALPTTPPKMAAPVAIDADHAVDLELDLGIDVDIDVDSEVDVDLDAEQVRGLDRRQQGPPSGRPNIKAASSAQQAGQARRPSRNSINSSRSTANGRMRHRNHRESHNSNTHFNASQHPPRQRKWGSFQQQQQQQSGSSWRSKNMMSFLPNIYSHGQSNQRQRSSLPRRASAPTLGSERYTEDSGMNYEARAPRPSQARQSQPQHADTTGRHWQRHRRRLSKQTQGTAQEQGQRVHERESMPTSSSMFGARPQSSLHVMMEQYNPLRSTSTTRFRGQPPQQPQPQQQQQQRQPRSTFHGADSASADAYQTSPLMQSSSQSNSNLHNARGQYPDTGYGSTHAQETERSGFVSMARSKLLNFGRRRRMVHVASAGSAAFSSASRDERRGMRSLWRRG